MSDETSSNDELLLFEDWVMKHSVTIRMDCCCFSMKYRTNGIARPSWPDADEFISRCFPNTTLGYCVIILVQANYASDVYCVHMWHLTCNWLPHVFLSIGLICGTPPGHRTCAQEFRPCTHMNRQSMLLSPILSFCVFLAIVKVRAVYRRDGCTCHFCQLSRS